MIQANLWGFFSCRVLQICLSIRSITVELYLYPNMINFDAVDFSERRSEEVISFFSTSHHICATAIIRGVV